MYWPNLAIALGLLVAVGFMFLFILYALRIWPFTDVVHEAFGAGPQAAPPPLQPEIELAPPAQLPPNMDPVIREAFEAIPRFDFPINDTTIAFNSNRCGVCLEKYEQGMEVLVTRCRHGYHPHCFEMFVNYNGARTRCPLCKVVIFQGTGNA